ncbi:thrombopoietin isoform X1 [Astyanax mexicanus]|uniref:thrombopoietin isoform X1 n=1 Tax=Astyanax mexicanus TaxID=7994 RepID=UPI0020CB5EFF|nr:thrombopoietin isoform X1 [Astyanax mexicanus]
MDLHKVLLVVLSMVGSDLSCVWSKPLDFICDPEARKVMNKVTELEQDLVDCSAAASLPNSIRLPCIKVHMATWRTKSVPQRRAEVLLSLGSLLQDVRRARDQSQLGCGLNLLERLDRSINNYLLVLTHLHKQVSYSSKEQEESEGTEAPACLGQDSQDLGLVLKHFGRLISGKLEWLVLDMAQAC